MRHYRLLVCCSLVIALSAAGCARARKNTEGFALSDSVVVEATVHDAWQGVKEVLRERELEIYTRDRDRLFVAFTPQKRHLLTPHRIQYEIGFEGLTNDTTRVNVTATRQVFGVSPLTHPDWHDRDLKDVSVVDDLLSAIKARFSS